ncbi:MAG: ABC transporter ATP-binding protein [Syntrophaceae bacterium]|nr:ABC transporter ATP-binding protein [Syntrophaceae bacterium]
MLRGEKITKRFGGLVAVSRLDFEVRDGEVVGLIGPNGSGKTTLFNVISGFYQPEEGTLTFRGKRIEGRKPYEISKMGIGRTFQIVKPLLNMTVLENIAIGVLYGRDGVRDMKTALGKSEEILHFTGLGKKQDALAENLKLADRKRLEIARAMATRPEILLLDEVFAGLNETEINEAIRLVQGIQQKFGTTIFIIEHVLKAIMKTCGRVIVINFGQKIAEGRPGEVTQNRAVIEAYLGNASGI